MNILLINPLVREWAQPNCFPLGLGYIAAVLRNEGYNVQVLDFNANRNLTQFAVSQPDLIGITGIITQYAEVKRIAKECKKTWPSIPIVCGGPLASSVPELLLKKTDIDICVIGEGENEILNIVKMIEKSVDVKKKIFRGMPQGNIDKFPFPAYNLFPTETYAKNPIAYYNANKWRDGKPGKEVPRSMNIIGSRGCMYNCLFCWHNFMGDGYRLRSAVDIVAEIQGLQYNYDVKYIHFTDDAFCSIPKKVIEFCTTLKANGVEIEWSCAGRANIVSEKLVSTMADAGCIGLCYGLESGSQKILDIMNKKVTIDQYRKAIKLNQKYFKYQDYSFIIGSPFETKETIQESIDFCKEMEIKPNAIFYMTPYPATPLFNKLRNSNNELFEPDFLYMYNNLFEEFILSLGEQGEKITWNCSKNLSDEQLIEMKNKFIEEVK